MPSLRSRRSIASSYPRREVFGEQRRTIGVTTSMAWVRLALAVALVAVIVVATRRRLFSPHSDSNIDVGPVSESWLAEQRGNKSSS
jgi:hypothetical protein